MAVLFCAQTPVLDVSGNYPSTCSTYRRSFSQSLEDCRTFCPAIEESCASAPPAASHCEDFCAQLHPSTYCEVLEVTGVPLYWPDDITDINTKYRLLVRSPPLLCTA